MRNEAIYHKSNIGYLALGRLGKHSLKKDSLKSNILQNDSYIDHPLSLSTGRGLGRGVGRENGWGNL
jgi:hypothetical protein